VGSRKEINKEHISQITRKSTWEVLVTRFDLNRKCNIQFYKEEKKEKRKKAKQSRVKMLASSL